MYLICVFNSDDEGTMMLFGIGIVKQGGSNPTEMHEAGGRGCVPNSDG